MVAVPVDHGLQVFVRPLIEQSGVAVLFLRDCPSVCQLVHHEESHPVAEVEEFRRRRIVGCADGVAAHLSEHVQPSHPRRLVPGGSERSGVVVQADSLDECPLPVDVQPVGLVLQVSESECGQVNVLPSASCGDGGDGLVEFRCLWTPEPRVFQFELLDDLVAVRDSVQFGHYGFPCFAVHDHLDRPGGRRTRIDDPDDLRAHCSSHGLPGVAERDPDADIISFRRDERPPLRHARGAGFRQVHVPVDSSSGIPSAGLPGIVQRNLDQIVPLLDERSQIRAERGVPVRPFGDGLPVTEDLGIGHRSAEIEEKPLSRPQVFRRHGKNL